LGSVYSLTKVSSAWPQNQPEFAGQWLYVEEEKLESDDPFRNLDKKYIKYIKDFERSEALDGGDMSAADGVGQGGDEMGWEGEQYEKSWRPKGVDKAFKRFTEIVQENPDQCIR
jgi:pre-rRNA-processing protein TSR4